MFVDNDPVSRYATELNCRLNEAGFPYLVAEHIGKNQFDLIVANLPLETIGEVSGILTDALAEGGKLLIGGFVVEDINVARSVFTSLSAEDGTTQKCDHGHQWTYLACSHY